MSNQIIKYPIPSQLLFDLLDKICLKKENYYLVDMNAYRKMMFHNYHDEFCNDLKEYYFVSKWNYLTREMTYKSLLNIIRQICKKNFIRFASQMKYNESNYKIDYLIYY
tara:strand:+ start:744 stop:1070 length:327 start_codon:yes stop_codon:yes gene_type:complete